MDWRALQEQIVDTTQRYLDIAKRYFADLSQMELYGWGAMGVGFILFLVGFIIWL